MPRVHTVLALCLAVLLLAHPATGQDGYQILHTFPSAPGPYAPTAILPNGRGVLLWASGNERQGVFRVAPGPVTAPVILPEPDVVAMAPAGDGTFYVLGVSGRYRVDSDGRVTTVATDQQRHRAALVAGHDGAVYGVRDTYAGNFSLSSSTVIRLNAGLEESVFEGSIGRVLGVTSDGTIYFQAFVSPDRYEVETIVRVRRPDGTIARLFDFGRSSVGPLVVEPDGAVAGSFQTRYSGPPEAYTCSLFRVRGAVMTVLREFPGRCSESLHSLDDGSLIGVAGQYLFRAGSDGTVDTVFVFSPSDIPHDVALLSDGSFWCTQLGGGRYSGGRVLRITPAGVLVPIADLTGFAPEGQVSGVMLPVGDGFLIPMQRGGQSGAGTIVHVTRAGASRVLYTFTGSGDGSGPRELAYGADGAIYGTTASTLFRLGRSGALTTLFTFREIDAAQNGWQPAGRLALGGDGALYGLTSAGGRYAAGTIYRTASSGEVTIVDHLTTQWWYPGLVAGQDGRLYGSDGRTLYAVSPPGTVVVIRGPASDDESYGGPLLVDRRNRIWLQYHRRSPAFCGLATVDAAGIVTTQTPSCSSLSGMVEAANGDLLAVGGGSLWRIQPDQPPLAVASLPDYAGGLVEGGDGTFYGQTFRSPLCIAPPCVDTVFRTPIVARPGRLRLERTELAALSPDGVALTWDASPGATPAGYIVEYGPTAGAHTASLDVGLRLSAVVTGLTPGTRYYFVVRPYITGGLKGGQSNEIAARAGVRTIVRADFSADRRADTAVYHPQSGTWSIRDVATGAVSDVQWGWPDDRPVPGDYDGDGRTDLAVFRPSTATWYVRNSGDGSIEAIQWGFGSVSGYRPADIPTPGDYDGDGRTDIAVYRPWEGSWYLRQSSDGAMRVLPSYDQAAQLTDIPLGGDFDGDGTTDLALFRPGTATFYIWNAASPLGWTQQWGWGGDVPVVGDFDGDGADDVTVYRPSTGTWYARLSSTGEMFTVQWGWAGDRPVTADYDGDGKTDIAVYRPSTSAWYIRSSVTGGLTSLQWGSPGDIPIGAP